jgi:hypothetical protein
MELLTIAQIEERGQKIKYFNDEDSILITENNHDAFYYGFENEKWKLILKKPIKDVKIKR